MRSTSDYQPPVSLSPPSLAGLPEQEDVFAVEHLSRLCDGLAQQRPNNLRDLLNTLALIAPLLNAIPNVVFFIKDAQARYLLANLTLARRCGFKTVTPLLGKTSADVFPAQLGSGYTEQDLRVLRHGVLIQDQLEMH
ncbi:MAG: PAS domain-containing protein, partial [Serratia marcescens]|nr:PAS domain-containing protein [Serratia marcescens]